MALESSKRAPKGGCQAAGPPNPKNWNLKNADFVDVMISEVLRDFPFSRDQPLKSADVQYIRILKNKLIKSKKKNKTGHYDWVMEHVVIFVCI
jgi:hypothetical protein